MLDVVAIALSIFGVYFIGYGLVEVFTCLGKSTVRENPKVHVLRFLLGWGSIFFIAGVASYFKIPFGSCLQGLIVLCLVSTLISFRKKGYARHVERSTSVTSYICIAIVIIVMAICTGLLAGVNSCDDPGRYFFLASRLWDEGNLFDPFNNWRTTVPGGALVVQSIGLRVAGSFGPIALDIGSGLTLLLVIGLVLKKWTTRIGLLLYSFMAAITNVAGIIPANTVPRYLPVALMLGSLLILFDKEFTNSNRLVTYPGVAMAVAACGMIRIQFLLFVALTVLIYLALNKFQDLRESVLIGIQVLFSLIPWVLSSLTDTGSAMFPIMMGNVDRAWMGNSLPSGINFPFIDRFLGIETLKFLIVSIAVIVLGRKHCRVPANRQVLAILSSACLTLAFFAYMAKANASVDISRYLAPIVICSVLLLICIDLLQNERHGGRRMVSVAIVTCLLSLGISSSNVGLRDIGQKSVQTISATARMLTSANREEIDLSNERASISSLLSHVPKDSILLSSIDNTELTLDHVDHSYSLGIPGFIYPKPHDMSWNLGLSPSSDVFEVSITANQLKMGEIYSLIQFGESGSADMVGIRNTPIGFQLVLEHWGYAPTFSNPWINRGEKISFRIEIDKTRGLVRKRDETSTSTMTILGGKFYETDGRAPYFVGGNDLGFSTVAEMTPDFLLDAISLVSTTRDEFYTQMLEDLKKRDVRYLLIQRPSSSICLYNETGWKINAVSRTLYENQAPYFFSWFDFGYKLLKQPNAVLINGDFALINLNVISAIN